MQYEILPVGQLATNCYLLWDMGSFDCLIIDPGDDADFIIHKIEDLELNPVRIILTHAHFDHILAVNELKTIFSIPMLMDEREEVILSKMRSSCRYFCLFHPGPPPLADSYFHEGEKIKFGGQYVRILETPGHTPGGVCFYSQKDNLLFCGDTIFADGAVGRTDLAEGDEELLLKSIKDKIFKLPDDTVLLPGHGEKSTIGREKQISTRNF